MNREIKTMDKQVRSTVSEALHKTSRYNSFLFFKQPRFRNTRIVTRILHPLLIVDNENNL